MSAPENEPELPYGHAPLHRSLTEPLFTVGLPDKAAVALWLSVAGYTLILHQLKVLVVGVIVHAAAAAVLRWDPHFFRIWARYKSGRRRLDP